MHSISKNLVKMFSYTEDHQIFSFLVTFYETEIVLEAFVLTIATTVALTLYTFQSKKDFSSWGAA